MIIIYGTSIMSRPFGKYAPADVAKFATAVAVFSEMGPYMGRHLANTVISLIATQKGADSCRHPLSGRDVALFAWVARAEVGTIVSVIPRVYLRRRHTEADLGDHCWLPAGGSRHSSKQSGGCTACVLRDRDRGSDQSGRADRIGMELPFVFPTHAILADFHC